MKSTNLFFIGALLMLLSSCSEKDQILDNPNSDRANITIVTQVGKVMSTSTRSSAPEKLDAKLFTLYAFEKITDTDTYNYQEGMGIGSEIVSGAGAEKSYVKYQASLPIGSYKFIAFYNLDEDNKSAIDRAIKGLNQGSEWDDILKSIVITHTTKSADMNEIFYLKEEDNEIVNISSGTEEGKTDININLTLKRLTSRIDVKFIKVATDGETEVPYKEESNCIFGAKSNLKSLSLNLKGSAELYTLYGTNDANTIDCNKNYPDLKSLLMYGKATANEVNNNTDYKPFPYIEAINSTEMKTFLEAGISKGGAYFMGSYLLPFDGENMLSGSITLTGEKDLSRIVNFSNLKSKMNYITVITIKLKSSTDSSDNGNGEDKENLFNPKATFTITVDYTYDGILQNDVEVE